MLRVCRELDICSDETFASKRANAHLPSWARRRSPENILAIGPLDAQGVMAHYMAGYERPPIERVLVLMQDARLMAPNERRFFHELFQQLSPLECHEFMVSARGTPRQMAAFMRTANIKRPLIVNWINHFSSDPNWREIEMISIVHGDKFAVVNGQTVPRHQAESIQRNLAVAIGRE